MKAEEQTILNETLVKVFKLTEEQVSQLYNADGDLTDLKIVIDADEKRVDRFNTEKKQQLDRGIKEGASKVEKAIKDKYAVESDLIGIDLVDSVVLSKIEEATKGQTKDVTKHPDYIKLESSIDKKLKERDADWETKLSEREREFNKAKLFDKIKEKALLNLETRNPILPTDPRKAQVWKDTYLNELKNANYQESEDGPIVLDKEGGILKDTHGNKITFDEFEKSISDKYFDYQAAEQRSSSGNQQSSQAGSGGEPKTKDGCLERLRDPKITPEDRKKFTLLMDTLKD